jgi:hypothetical protein
VQSVFLAGRLFFIFAFCISRMLLQRGMWDGRKSFLNFSRRSGNVFADCFFFCTWFEQGWVLQMGRREKQFLYPSG